MSHYRKRKEENIIPSPSREVSANTTVLDTDSYIIANGPASSGGGPGFTRQTDAVDWKLVSEFARYNTGATIGTSGNNITMSVWEKPTTASAGALRPLFLMYSNLTTDAFLIEVLSASSASDFQVSVRKGAGIKKYVITPNVNADDWSNFTFTYVQSTQTLRMYMNGIEDTTPTKTLDTSPDSFSDNSSRIIEIANIGGGGGPLHIALSGAIWDGVLTSAEIATIYNAGDGGNFDLNFNQGNYGSSSNLIHWYRFGHQQSPNIFFDYTEAGSFAHDLDSTNIANGDIIVDAPGTSSAITVTLPDNITNDARQVTVQDKQGSAAGLAVTVAAAGSDNINGSATDTINTARGSKTYISDGTGTWRTVFQNTAADAPANVTSEGATGTLLPTQEVVMVTTGGVTITLPSAITEGSGKVFYIKDSGGNATADPITIDADGSQTIDGALTTQLTQNFDSITIISDGANWFLI